MTGILLIDKPASWTSHDVVAKVQNILKSQAGQKIKVGHSGTLDPFATGLLVLLVGSYTKKAPDFSKLNKTYEAVLTLGKTSSTGDPEGEITELSNRVPSQEEIEKVLQKFTGIIQQVPHAFSAKKIDGQRAYKLARAGNEVKLEPQKVQIHGFENINYEYPFLEFTVGVSSGTYIRSLAEDIGKELGVGGYLTSLRRTRVGDFDIKDAQKLGDLQNTSDLLKFTSE